MRLNLIKITFYIQDEQKGIAQLCKKCLALCREWESHVCPGNGPFVTAPSTGSKFAIDTGTKRGARGDVVVKALRYKPAGRGFDSRLCHCNFSVT
jgi:hypothetical protein